MSDSRIEWTQKTWNPVRGCSRVSPGCDNCYAMGQAHRFSAAGGPYEGLTTIRRGKVDWAGMARLVPEQLAAPLSWSKPQRIFVNSMSDLFHESLSNEEIAAVFGVMAACPQHTFQVLTKRPKRMAEWFKWVAEASSLPGGDGEVRRCLGSAHTRGFEWKRHIRYPLWPLPYVWLGVSVENQEQADKRIPLLLETPAAVRFISAEPLLGPVDLLRADSLDLGGPTVSRDFLAGGTWRKEGRAERWVQLESGPRLDWVIVGGESGHGARSTDVVWHRSLRDQCAAAGVAFFEKQLGALPVDTAMPSLTLELASKKGSDPDEWPEDLRVRQFPEVTRG